MRGRRARRDGNVVMVAALGGGCKARAKEGTGVGPPHKREGVNPRVLLPMRAQNARRACARARQLDRRRRAWAGLLRRGCSWRCAFCSPCVLSTTLRTRASLHYTAHIPIVPNTPTVGLKPTTTRLRALRSAD